MFQFPGFASHGYVFTIRYPQAGGFPHSDMFGSKLVYQLPEPFRRLPRPSSPLTAKASTVHAWSLDHITQNSFLIKVAFNRYSELHTNKAFVLHWIYDLRISFCLTVLERKKDSTGLTLDYRLFQKSKLLKSKFSAKH